MLCEAGKANAYAKARGLHARLVVYSFGEGKNVDSIFAVWNTYCMHILYVG